MDRLAGDSRAGHSCRDAGTSLLQSPPPELPLLFYPFLHGPGFGFYCFFNYKLMHIHCAHIRTQSESGGERMEARHNLAVWCGTFRHSCTLENAGPLILEAVSQRPRCKPVS